MSETTYAPPPAIEIGAPRLREAAELLGQLAAGLCFAATIYLCVAWPGLID